jgi:hypothetical protein
MIFPRPFRWDMVIKSASVGFIRPLASPVAQGIAGASPAGGVAEQKSPGPPDRRCRAAPRGAHRSIEGRASRADRGGRSQSPRAMRRMSGLFAAGSTGTTPVIHPIHRLIRLPVRSGKR